VLLRPFLKVFCGVNVIGRRNLRGLERFIIVANHNSHFDVLLLFYALPLRLIPRTHPVADLPYFSQSTLLKRLVDFLLDPVWIVREREKRERDPLADIGACLDRGDNIVIFPEGTRGEPGTMLAFKPGVGRLCVDRPGLPVVPVFLSGPERALPRSARLPLPFWQHIVIAPPQEPQGSATDTTAALERAVTDLAVSNVVRRQTRRTRRARTTPVVAILGIDGSGKSTQAERTARALSRGGTSCVVRDELRLFSDGEPRDLQPLLTETIRRRISARAKRAQSLGSYRIPKLADLFLRDHLLGEIERWYHPDVTVTDGSPLLNMVAWSALYKGARFDAGACAKIIDVLTGTRNIVGRNDPLYDDYPELRHLQRLRLTRLRRPDAILFMDVTAAVACARIEARGEHRQVHETEEQLARLRSAYRDVCVTVERQWHVPTLFVDGARTVDTITDEIVDFCREALAKEGHEVGTAH